MIKCKIFQAQSIKTGGPAIGDTKLPTPTTKPAAQPPNVGESHYMFL